METNTSKMKPWFAFQCKCGLGIKAEPSDVKGAPNRDCDGDVVDRFPVIVCPHCFRKKRVPRKLRNDRIRQIALANPVD